MNKYQSGMVNGIMLSLSAVSIVLEKKGYTREEITEILGQVKEEMDSQKDK